MGTFLFDIALGLLISVMISFYVGLEINRVLLLSGLVGSLWSDWDMLVFWIRHRKINRWAHRHRDIGHYPLIMIPLGGAIWMSIFGLWPGIIFMVATLSHYLNDSYGIGWGVRWLWLTVPVIGEKRHVGVGLNRYLSLKDNKIQSRTPEELDNLATQFGNDNWTKEKKMWTRDIFVFITIITLILMLLWYI